MADTQTLFNDAKSTDRKPGSQAKFSIFSQTLVQNSNFEIQTINHKHFKLLNGNTKL